LPPLRGGLILARRRYLPPLPAVVGDSSHLSTLCRGGTDPGSRFLPRLCWGSAALGGEEVGSPVVSVWRRIDPLGGSVPCQVRFGLTPPHPIGFVKHFTHWIQ